MIRKMRTGERKLEGGGEHGHFTRHNLAPTWLEAWCKYVRTHVRNTYRRTLVVLGQRLPNHRALSGSRKLHM